MSNKFINKKRYYKIKGKFSEGFKTLVSKPLLFQSVKANWVLWLACSVTMSAMVVIINTLLGKQGLTSFNIDMFTVARYVLFLEFNGMSLNELISALGFNPNLINTWMSFDVNSMMDNMYYTMGSVLIPMIYVLITSNKLLVDQVDRGSMAYVLSTPTKRSTVVRTQMLFLIISIVFMYVIQFLAAIISAAIVVGSVDVGHVAVLNLGGAITMVALAGICFLFSALFNSSKYSYAAGGALSVFFFLTKVLGMFGNDMFTSVGIGVESMGIFNYMSMLSLLDTYSLSDGDIFTFVWKLAVLVGIAVVTFVSSVFVFDKKDLSL